ncbi:hypothetical protein ACWFR1_34610 [Streptomyces sp. NPDC055103]
MAGTALPQARPDAEIILCVSAKEGLVAIPVGDKYSHGHTALRSTGAFEKQKAGFHVLRDLTTMRDVMPALAQAAKLYRVALTTSSNPYLGDYAQKLARCLPGDWTAKVEIYAHPVWQEDWLPLLWDSGQLTEVMERCRVPYGAVLTSSTGAELLLITAWRHRSLPARRVREQHLRRQLRQSVRSAGHRVAQIPEARRRPGDDQLSSPL